MNSFEPVLTLSHLTKLYGPGCADCISRTGAEAGSNICPICQTVVAVNDVSLTLHKGEVVGIVGESGSGKSTVIRTIHFDLEPTAGSMTLAVQAKANQHDGLLAMVNGSRTMPALDGGCDVFRLSSFAKRQLRNKSMGIVYQNPLLGLRMNFSASGNVAERLLMDGWDHVGHMRERIAGLFTRTEVDLGRMDQPPVSFSGGMQQRVQIARALSTEPQILLLDEVTTGLDVSVQARVLDLLRSLTRELGLATIVVSHDLGVIRLLTSRTLVMKNGQVVESGLTNQILEDPQHPYTQLLVSSTL
jgi:putative phosphonate transport system ATP-binding protein